MSQADLPSVDGVAITHGREITSFERRYTELHLRKLRRRVSGDKYAGVFLVLLGVLIVYFAFAIVQGERDAQVGALVGAYGLVAASMGGVLFVATRRRKLVLHSRVYRIEGVISEASGRAGGMTQVRSYMRAMEVLWPRDFGIIAFKHVGQTLFAQAALIELEGGLRWRWMPKVYRDPPCFAVLLLVPDVLDVDLAVRKYGLDLFKLSLKEVLVAGAFCLFLAAFVGIPTHFLMPYLSSGWITVFVLLMVLLGFALLVIIFRYIDRLTGPTTELQYEEKAKGL